MDVVILQVLVSLGLVSLAVLLFMRTVRARDLEHADRLALLPVEDDDAQPVHIAARALHAVQCSTPQHAAPTHGTTVAEAPRTGEPIS